MSQKVTITKIYRNTTDRDGNPLISKKGKPWVSVGLYTKEYGDQKLSGFGSYLNEGWKEGDVEDTDTLVSTGEDHPLAFRAVGDKISCVNCLGSNEDMSPIQFTEYMGFIDRQKKHPEDMNIIQLAMKSKNITICNKVQSNEERNYCMAVFKKDISLCKKTTYPVKNLCFIGVALENEDISGCNLIESQEMKDVCYYNIAVSKKDTTICEKISTQDYRDTCYNSVASVAE